MRLEIWHKVVPRKAQTRSGENLERIDIVNVHPLGKDLPANR
jgi:hypothetical protein